MESGDSSRKRGTEFQRRSTLAGLDWKDAQFQPLFVGCVDHDGVKTSDRILTQAKRSPATARGNSVGLKLLAFRRNSCQKGPKNRFPNRQVANPLPLAGMRANTALVRTPDDFEIVLQTGNQQ